MITQRYPAFKLKQNPRLDPESKSRPLLTTSLTDHPVSAKSGGIIDLQIRDLLSARGQGFISAYADLVYLLEKDNESEVDFTFFEKDVLYFSGITYNNL
ncbi:hypothetical protein SDC9_17431 [bioreactor metagenome]|uniref:Uncharacterized protein n=1 Tax=bioreactor metagenome TaxID=1076179 RepID=A0A644TXE7_9ZZZZ